MWHEVRSDTSKQSCGVGRFFRIPTLDSSSFEKPTPTPAVLKNRLRLQQFLSPTPTPAIFKKRLRLQLKTCDSSNYESTSLQPLLAVTAVVARL